MPASKTRKAWEAKEAKRKREKYNAGHAEPDWAVAKTSWVPNEHRASDGPTMDEMGMTDSQQDYYANGGT